MYKYSAKLAIGTLIYAFAVLPGYGDSIVETLLNPEPGSKALVEYTLTKIKSGEESQATIAGWIHINDVTDDGFEASWTTVSVAAGGMVLDKSHPQAKVYLIDQPFEFRADSDGLPIKLLKADEILNHMAESGVIGEPGSQAMDRVLAYFRGLADEDLAQIFLKVPTLMSACQGTMLEEGVLHDNQEQITNPFGEGMITLYTRYRLTSVGGDANLAKIEFRSTINRDGLSQMAQELIKKIAPERKGLARELDNSDADLKTLIDCEVDMQTGWVQSFEASQIIDANDFYAEETYDVRLKWSD